MKKLLGWFLIVLGLVIALTPFTPGSILLLIGADMVFEGRLSRFIKNLLLKLNKFFK